MKKVNFSYSNSIELKPKLVRYQRDNDTLDFNADNHFKSLQNCHLMPRVHEKKIKNYQNIAFSAQNN
jgi:hypothetical protein